MNDDINNEASITGKQEGRWVHGSKVAAIFIVLACGLLIMKYLKDHGPEADKEQPPRVVPTVRVLEARTSSSQLTILTQGRVEPVTSTQAASEVTGRLVMVSPKFKAGGEFAPGEVMLEIDNADYTAALANARSAWADAQLQLQQEEARAQQAQRDWQKLGRGEPSALVMRQPQIESARARAAAAQATVEKASRDLERTRLRAPYHCRIAATYTDLGSYIVAGNRLADMYSADAFEARVPVTLEELGYLDNDRILGSKAVVEAVLGGRARQWEGEVVRNEGRVDRETMTVHLVLSIKPDKQDPEYALPPPGLFVRASIQGKKIDGVISLPRSALQPDHTLLTVNGDGELEVVSVQLTRTLHNTVLVSGGVEEGTKIIVSPLETPVPGMKLTVQGHDDSVPVEPGD